MWRPRWSQRAEPTVLEREEFASGVDKERVEKLAPSGVIVRASLNPRRGVCLDWKSYRTGFFLISLLQLRGAYEDESLKTRLSWRRYANEVMMRKKERVREVHCRRVVELSKNIHLRSADAPDQRRKMQTKWRYRGEVRLTWTTVRGNMTSHTSTHGSGEATKNLLSCKSTRPVWFLQSRCTNYYYSIKIWILTYQFRSDSSYFLKSSPKCVKSL